MLKRAPLSTAQPQQPLFNPNLTHNNPESQKKLTPKAKEPTCLLQPPSQLQPPPSSAS